MTDLSTLRMEREPGAHLDPDLSSQALVAAWRRIGVTVRALTRGDADGPDA